MAGNTLWGAWAMAHRRKRWWAAVVMVALTTLTLWSLGQDLVITPEQQQEQAAARIGE